MSNLYGDLIAQTAQTYGLDARLLTAQVQIESAFHADAFRYESGFYVRYIQHNPQAKGFAYGPLAACSFGLLQILFETALEIGFAGAPERLFTPAIGLTWGARYLQQCLHRAGGDYRVALASYNGAGPAAVVYADKVLAAAS